MSRQSYTTDLIDDQWQRLQECLPKATNGRTGRPRKHDLREVVNALFYQLHNGCTWRDLPHDFPPWTSVYDQFRRWRDDATLECLHDALREKVRLMLGREATPSAATIDSQSVKTAEKGALVAALTGASASRDASVTLP